MTDECERRSTEPPTAPVGGSRSASPTPTPATRRRPREQLALTTALANAAAHLRLREWSGQTNHLRFTEHRPSGYEHAAERGVSLVVGRFHLARAPSQVPVVPCCCPLFYRWLGASFVHRRSPPGTSLASGAPQGFGQHRAVGSERRGVTSAVRLCLRVWVAEGRCRSGPVSRGQCRPRHARLAVRGGGR